MVSAAMSPLAVATPTVAPSATAAPQAQPGHFAKELSRHTQDAPAKREEAPAEKRDDKAADDAAQSPQAQPTRAREPASHGAGKAPKKSETGTQDAKKSDAAATDDEHIAQDEHAPVANAAADLSAWIATLNRPAAPPPAAGGLVPEQAGDADAEATGQAAAQRLPLAAANADAAIAGAKDDTRARPECSASGFAPALATRTQDAPLSPAHDKNAVPDLAQKLAEPSTTALPQAPAVQAAAAPAAPAHAEATPVTASIAAHTHSDEFAPAIAAQVSILARDGVHEAQLHLNPAETGPIAVRIEVVAAQAHIDFSAEKAATRSAIEASLPDLAAALRDAGLTLAGGGVFQQSARQQQRGDGDERGTPAAGSRRSAAADRAAPSVPVRRNVRAGGLDLYA